MSDFDPETFLSSANVDGPLSTRTAPVPEGTYRAQIDKIDLRQIEGKDGKPNRVIMSVVWDILDDAVRAELEREKVTSRQDIWLDTDASGGLDTGKGKNVGLGRLREALGMNDKPGNPFEGLVGQMARVMVSHRSDTRDSEVKYDEVKRVAAID